MKALSIDLIIIHIHTCGCTIDLTNFNFFILLIFRSDCAATCTENGVLGAQLLSRPSRSQVGKVLRQLNLCKVCERK